MAWSLLLLLFTFPFPARALTTSGAITNAESWSGTVTLSGDVRIEGRGVLTLQPGTRVLFDHRLDDQVSGQDTSRIELILAGGTLQALGTAEAPIVLTSARANGLAGDWYGLRLTGGKASLAHLRSELGIVGLRISGAGEYAFESLTTTRNAQDGLWIDGPGAYAFPGLQSAANARHGIFLSGTGNKLALSRARIAINGDQGIAGATAELTVADSEIVNNAGLGLGGAAVWVARTTVSTNGRGGLVAESLEIADADVLENRGTGIQVEGAARVTRVRSHRNTGAALVIAPRACCTVLRSDVSDSQFLDNAGDGIYSGNFSDLHIDDCLVRGNAGYGIRALASVRVNASVVGNQRDWGIQGGTAEVLGSSVFDNKGGIAGTRLSVRGSAITGNGEQGILLLETSGSQPAVFGDGIVGNLVRSNGLGMEFHWNLANGRIPVLGNDLFGNVTLELRNLGTAAVIASDNYWGPDTTRELQQGLSNLSRVYERQDNGAVGSVSVQAYRTALATAGPVITQPPVASDADPGNGAEFLVTVSGTEPLRYQWLRNGNELTDQTRVAGSRTNRLTLTAVTLAEAGSYSVVVRNAFGDVVSSPVVLSVGGLTGTHHSADYRDPKWKLDGTEINGVLALWRAGSFGLDAAAPAGYAPGAVNPAGPRHSADWRTPYWKLDGTEVNRTLSYWRAGAYHPSPNAEDGFAVGASAAPSYHSGLALASPRLASTAPPSLRHASTPGYSAGSTLVVSNEFTFTGRLLSLGARPELPPGWTLESATGDGAPEAADGEIIFVASTLPSPLRFNYLVRVPAGASGAVSIRTRLEYQLEGAIRPVPLYAEPDPLTVGTGGGTTGFAVEQSAAPIYTAGSRFWVTNRLTFSGILLSLGSRPQLPAGWALGALAGEGIPASADGDIVFFGDPLPNPLVFRYEVIVSAGESGPHELRNRFEYQLAGALVPTPAFATPNPLPVETVRPNTPPAVVLTAPVTDASLPSSGPVLLRATATDSDGIARVEFFVDGTRLGEDSTDPFTFPWADPSVGPHTAVARATDTRGASTETSLTRFTITAPPGREVRFGAAAAPPGGPATVPVEILADGQENSVGFTVVWDAAQLEFLGSTAAPGLPPGTQVLVNSSQAANGRVGFTISLPFGQGLPAGTQTLVQLNLRIAGSTPPGSSLSLDFGDSPVFREITSPDIDLLEAAFLPGRIEIGAGLEGDVAPRPAGNARLTASDWTLVGRFVAGLTPIPTGGEFSRADVAPRTTRGDGRLTPADGSQTGRYVAGIDAAQTLGGPGGGSSPSLQSLPPASVVTSGPRLVRPGTVAGTAGSLVVIPLELVATGGENAVGLSLLFNAGALTYVSTAPAGTLPSGTQWFANTNRQGNGRLGFLLALPAGQGFPAGTHRLAELTFRVASEVSGRLQLTADDDPVIREVASVEAEVMPSQFGGGAVVLGGLEPPSLVAGSLRFVNGRPSFELVGQAGAPWAIEASPDLLRWTEVGTVTTTGGPVGFTDLTPSESRRFYRLRSK